MSWIGDLIKDSADRQHLVQLQANLADLGDRFQAEKAQLPHGSDEWRQTFAQFSNEAELLVSEIRAIETAQMLRRARRWKVALPPEPFGEDEETEYWGWYGAHQRHYLRDAGLSHLRREVYQEWEMWSKPWLSITAVAISVVSLAISLLK